VEGADIDARSTERGTEPADEAGGILVDDIEHAIGQIGLNLDAENLD